jgi:hypothetical protein
MKTCIVVAACGLLLAMCGTAHAFTKVQLKCVTDDSRAMGFITKDWPGVEGYAVATTLHAINQCKHLQVVIRPCDGSQVSRTPDLDFKLGTPFVAWTGLDFVLIPFKPAVPERWVPAKLREFHAAVDPGTPIFVHAHPQADCPRLRHTVAETKDVKDVVDRAQGLTSPEKMRGSLNNAAAMVLYPSDLEKGASGAAVTLDDASEPETVVAIHESGNESRGGEQKWFSWAVEIDGTALNIIPRLPDAKLGTRVPDFIRTTFQQSTLEDALEPSIGRRFTVYFGATGETDFQPARLPKAGGMIGAALRFFSAEALGGLGLAFRTDIGVYGGSFRQTFLSPIDGTVIEDVNGSFVGMPIGFSLEFRVAQYTHYRVGLSGGVRVTPTWFGKLADRFDSTRTIVAIPGRAHLCGFLPVGACADLLAGAEYRSDLVYTYTGIGGQTAPPPKRFVAIVGVGLGGEYDF